MEGRWRSSLEQIDGQAPTQPLYWRAIHTTGRAYTYTFGQSQAAWSYDRSDATKCVSWLIERITDTSGNAIEFDCERFGNQRYLSVSVLRSSDT